MIILRRADGEQVAVHQLPNIKAPIGVMIGRCDTHECYALLVQCPKCHAWSSFQRAVQRNGCHCCPGLHGIARTRGFEPMLLISPPRPHIFIRGIGNAEPPRGFKTLKALLEDTETR